MERLTKLDKKILDICIRNLPNPTSYQHLDILKDKYDINRVYSACRSLKRRGYFDNSLFADGGTPLYILISDDAASYKEFSRLEVKDFLIRSVAVPIVVSVFTTLIVIGIQHLFI